MEFKGKYLSARKKLIESLAYKKFSKVHGKCLLGKKSEFQSSYCIYNSMEKHYIVYIYIYFWFSFHCASFHVRNIE